MTALVPDPHLAEEEGRQHVLDQDGALRHVGQVLCEHLLLQLPQVRDGDGDEEVEHGDGAKDDQGHQDDHGKGAAGLVLLKRVVKVPEVELAQRHGQGHHKALPRTLEAILDVAVVDDHEGEGVASNHEAHGHHVAGELLDDVVEHDAEVSALEGAQYNSVQYSE